MNHTCWVANVCMLIQEDHIHSVVSEMVNAYSNFAGEDRRGTRIHDVLQWDKTITAQGQTRQSRKRLSLRIKYILPCFSWSMLLRNIAMLPRVRPIHRDSSFSGTRWFYQIVSLSVVFHTDPQTSLIVIAISYIGVLQTQNQRLVILWKYFFTTGIHQMIASLKRLS
jgi:hypothetical protein